MSKPSKKIHFSLEDKINILQRLTRINHSQILTIAKILDEYPFETLRELTKAIRMISRGTDP